jgi:uncharacterized protein (DUF1800 family)
VNERELIALMHRRVGFGLNGIDLDAAVKRGLKAERNRLLDPSRSKVAVAPDPWGTDSYFVAPSDRTGARREQSIRAVTRWIDAMVASPRPAIERMTWQWHGHFVVSQAEVKNPQFMVDHLRMLRTIGLGGFAGLVSAVTTDPAMLIYLNGDDSTAKAPNENYGRELLELFTVGHGNFTETDVQAAARALTGWVVRPARGERAFVPARHDPTPQRFLGTEGVNDVATVVAAVMKQPALAPFIAGKFARWIVGPEVAADVVDVAAEAFRTSGFQVSALIASLTDHLVLRGPSGAVVASPLAWYVAARRVTGAAPGPELAIGELSSAGQVPLYPPNVGGWPSGRAWLSTAPAVARFNLASMVASATSPTAAPAVAAQQADWAGLARSLGLAANFGATTIGALSAVSDRTSRLALALCSPEFVIQ